MKTTIVAAVLLLSSLAARAQLSCPGDPPLRLEKGPYGRIEYQLTSAQLDAWLQQVRTVCEWGASVDPFPQYLTAAEGNAVYSGIGPCPPGQAVTTLNAGSAPTCSAVSAGTPAAADVTIADAGGYYTGAQVEAALQEAGASLATKAPLSHTHAASEITTGTLANGRISASSVTQHESALESVLDLQDMQGAVTDAQVPNGITVDLATTATTATAGDSATGFFPSGTLEAALLPAATTTTQGASVLATPSSDTAAGHVVQANDARLSDSRSPTAHTHPASAISDSTAAGRAVLTAADAAAQRTALGLGTASIKDVPSSGNASSVQVVKGDDTRLSDSRAPTGSAGGDLAGTYPNPTVAANSVALGTDTTGGYAASSSEGGAASSVAANSVALGTDTTGGYAASTTEGGPATTASALASGADVPLATVTVTGGGIVSKCARFDASHHLIEASGDCPSGDTGGGGGETNTASNLGGGLANFDSKSGVDLRFNTFAAADFDLGTNLITIDDAKWAKDSELPTTLAGDVNGAFGTNDLDELAVETELEGVLDLPDLQGAVTDAQVPDSITVDLATVATTANAGDSATAFFSAGTVEAARLPALSGLTGAVTDGQVPNSITIDLASTATALAANGANCTAGSYPLGVDASGAVESCTVAGAGGVTSVATASGVTGGTITGTGTLALDYTATLAGNPTMAAGECRFSTTGVICEGATADAFETLLTPADPGADKTITFPATTGTVVTTGDSATVTNGMLASSYSGVGAAGANQFLTATNANGAPTAAQPAFSNLSGSATDAQIPNSITVDLATLATNVTNDDDIPEAGDYTNLSATSPITQSGGTISTSIATGRLVGRTTASTGAMEQLTPDATLSLAAGAVGVVDVTCTACLGTTEIAALDTADVTTGAFADARVDGSLEADEVNPTLGTQTQGNYVADVLGGAGLVASGSAGEGWSPSLATDSTEAGFLASGALTCGAATAGKMKVHTTPLQYCDNTATPVLQYAAYGNSSGVATSATTSAALSANYVASVATTAPVTGGAAGSNAAALTIAVSTATTGALGVVQLETSSSDTTGGATHVVTSSDTRLSDSRAPNGTATGDLTGSYPNPTIANITTAATQAGTIVATNIAAPASPAAGKVALYSDSTDLRFHDKNASGAIGTTVVADTGAASNFLTAISAAGAISKARPTCSSLSDSAASCATDATNASNLGSGTLPAARLPNPSASTLGGVQSAAAVSNQWVNSISTSGVPALSQPAFSNLSGTVSDTQIAASAVDGGVGGEIEDGTITKDDLGAASVEWGSEIANDLGCAAAQTLRRNPGDTAWECFTPGAGSAGTVTSITPGAGINGTAAITTSGTIATDSTEANFLTDGGASSLTCGSSNQGKAQVMDDGTLQYCDGATTSVLRSPVTAVTSTDKAIARYSGTAGQVQDSEVTISDIATSIVTISNATASTGITIVPKASVSTYGRRLTLLGGDGNIGAGGKVVITGGVGNGGSSPGGTVEVTGGAGGSNDGDGGALNLTGGTAGTGTGSGGSVFILGGVGGTTNGAGGALLFRGGTGGATNGNGGNAVVQAGAKDGSGTNGSAVVENNGATNTLTCDDTSCRFAGTRGAGIAGGWDSAVTTTTDRSTTSATAVNITDLSVALDINTTYEFEATLETNSSTTAGCKYAVNYSVAGATVNAIFTGMTTATAASSVAISALATLEGTAFNAVAADTMTVIKGWIKTGANAGNLTMQQAKVTSGTAIVRKNSILKVRAVGAN